MRYLLINMETRQCALTNHVEPPEMRLTFTVNGVEVQRKGMHLIFLLYFNYQKTPIK